MYSMAEEDAVYTAESEDMYSAIGADVAQCSVRDPAWFVAERIHHDLLDFSVSLLLDYQDDFLVLLDFLVEVDLCDKS